MIVSYFKFMFAYNSNVVILYKALNSIRWFSHGYSFCDNIKKLNGRAHF